MSLSLGWNKKDADGRRIKVQFDLIRTDATWKLKPARHERWEPFSPEDEDWEQLFDVLDRNYARGKIKPEDVTLLRRLHREQTA